MWRPRIRAAVVLCVVALAIAAPITALAGLSSIDVSGILKIDLEGGGKGCGNGNGNGNQCPTTTTTTVPTTTTTRPDETTTTLPCLPVLCEPTTTTSSTTTTTRPTTTTTTRPPTTTTTQPPATTTTSSAPGGGTDDSEGGGGPGGGESSGATGLGSVDRSGMSSSMAGAVEMMTTTTDSDSTVAEGNVGDGGMGMMSDGLYDVLSPVLPPALVDAVSSPLVILDALLGALASSGQALIVPAIAFLFGFGVPSVRRRVSLEDLEEAA